MNRRNFLLISTALMATPAALFAQDYPPVTRAQLDAALAELQTAFPERFAELGTATGRIVRRGNAIYVYYSEGRIRLLQSKAGDLRLPSDALVLKSDPVVNHDNGDDAGSGGEGPQNEEEEGPVPHGLRCGSGGEGPQNEEEEGDGFNPNPEG